MPGGDRLKATARVVVVIAAAGVQAAAPPAVRAAGEAPPDGRVLLSELSCTACHAPSSPDSLLAPKRGPVLDGLGARVRAGWLRRFLADPQGTQPGTLMPHLLHHLDDDETAKAATVENLVHFLMADPGRPAAVPRHADPAGGRQLYERIGCAACHGDTPLGVEEKYTLGSLTAFLLDPHRIRPSARMPAMALDRNEAQDLAGFLLGIDPEQAPDQPTFTPEPKRVAEGRAAFDKLGCASCHARAGTAAPPVARPLAELDPDAAAGCLSNPRAGLPAFALDGPLRDALAAFVGRPLPVMEPADRVAVTLEAFACLACHARDGRGGPPDDRIAFFTGDAVLGNEGRLPPDLTKVGRKLTLGALAGVLAGGSRVRPHLDTRMPEFRHPEVDGLPALLEQVDAAADPDPELDARLASADLDAGRVLAGTEGGMGCITCHGWNDRAGLAMPAIHLSTMAQRLRPSWFREALLDPQAVRPGTLMPAFWPGGVSGNPGVLGGDTEAQIAALWRYLAEGTEAPDGFPEIGSTEFEIVPAGRPVVQRGFIEPAGTHAIAVGFPEGVHFVFDARGCVMVAAWRGRFLDGHGLWFSRMDPTARPLGGNLVLLPRALPVEWTGVDDGAEAVFRGYRLEHGTGVPVFLYDIGPLHVTDRIEPLANADGESGLRRTITATTMAPGIGFRPARGTVSGVAIEASPGPREGSLAPDEPRTLDFRYTW